MAKAHQHEHVEDFIAAYANGAEMTGWIAYEQLEDERQQQQLAATLVKVFGGGGKPVASSDDDEEEVIDTTSPEFAQTFKGFTGIPGQRQAGRR